MVPHALQFPSMLDALQETSLHCVVKHFRKFVQRKFPSRRIYIDSSISIKIKKSVVPKVIVEWWGKERSSNSMMPSAK